MSELNRSWLQGDYYCDNVWNMWDNEIVITKLQYIKIQTD